jgi:indole-3-acetate monooxygenase
MMKIFELPAEAVKVLREQAQAAESLGMLSDEQLRVIHQQNWFNLFVPHEYGGLALSLPDAVRLEESLAYADGNTGWVVTLCAGAALFIGFFNEELRNEIFSQNHVCIAGSGQATGIAKRTGNGYDITGSWPYASGAAHATHFTANCTIDGSAEIKSFVFTKDEVELVRDWNYIGLKATSGYSFSVKALQVPVTRCFVIDAAHATLAGDIYRYPFLQLAEATISANISGMCMCFFDLAEALLQNKAARDPLSAAVRMKGLEIVRTAIADINVLRKKFYAALETSWSAHVSEKEVSECKLEGVSENGFTLARQARNLVNELYPYCGMEAARLGSVVNQVWRNINTASQHILLQATA